MFRWHNYPHFENNYITNEEDRAALDQSENAAYHMGMKYNFDEIIDRRNTNSIKHDFAAEYGKPDGLIPLWVADMDFKVPRCITEALAKSVEHSVFGYSEAKENGAYFVAVQKWFSQRFGFDVDADWLVKTPGLVFAMNAAIRAFTKQCDAILIQPPVYGPIKRCVETNGRKLVTNPLVYANGEYRIDIKDFEDKIVKNDVRLFILCSPHNPVGRVWEKDELAQIGEICLKHNVLVVSDEIHCDFVYEGNRHTIFGAICESFLSNSIICTAPSKTFNIAGLQASNTFIADPELRQKFIQEICKTGYGKLNTMALVATQAAYENGGEWLGELLAYLKRNYNYAKDFIAANLPKARLAELQGTYLLWLDLSSYGLSESELDRIIVEKAGLWVNKGSEFGDEGNGFVRINIGCPLSILEKAFARLAAALR